MALYLDTSCMLKVFFPEPETGKTLAAISAESRVVVSSLVRLETLSQIHGRVVGGLLSASRAGRLLQRVEAVLKMAPYEPARCPADLIEIAEAQLQPLQKSVYCRTLDRLHLAAMEALGVRRLLTNDDTQAAAARALGFQVLLPR
jgi:predicted nucleic acid-binding protein